MGWELLPHPTDGKQEHLPPVSFFIRLTFVGKGVNSKLRFPEVVSGILVLWTTGRSICGTMRRLVGGTNDFPYHTTYSSPFWMVKFSSSPSLRSEFSHLFSYQHTPVWGKEGLTSLQGSGRQRRPEAAAPTNAPVKPGDRYWAADRVSYWDELISQNGSHFFSSLQLILTFKLQPLLATSYK